MLLHNLKLSPEKIQFDDVIVYIDAYYTFVPTAFKNGDLYNEANQNNASCKIFSFAQLHQLSPEKTLALFGDFYRIDVMQNPNGNDHQNIRNFILHGWNGLKFETEALQPK